MWLCMIGSDAVINVLGRGGYCVNTTLPLFWVEYATDYVSGIADFSMLLQ